MTLKLLFIVVVVAQTLAPVPAHVRVSVSVCAFWGLNENAMGASDILRQKEHNLRRHLNLIFYLTIPAPSFFCHYHHIRRDAVFGNAFKTVIENGCDIVK